MKPLLATTFGLALLCASCDSGSDSPAPAPDNHAGLLIGKWAPVINSAGQYFDFRDGSHLVVQMRGWVNDSIPFSYTTSGSDITLTTGSTTEKGTFRFFGNDSMEFKVPSAGIGALCKRIETIPAP